MIYALLGLVLVLIVALWLQQRESGLIAWRATEFLQERIRKLDAERESLLTRIQLWDANPKVPERAAQPPSGSPADDARAEDQDTEHRDQMAKRGLRANTEGGYLDESGHLFWTFGAYDEWIDYKEANKLPADANPLDFMGTGRPS